ncbi:antitoxin [Bordetella tumbae]|uniref:antitoxin n=1 Tax=Bordetella tumbae TaxID=1649139 RepID=UPI0039F0C41B
MSRLTIDVTDKQHQALKAMAALEGKTIKQYALERLFPQAVGEEQALYELKTLLNERLAQAERGELEEGSISDIAMMELRRSKVR